LRLERAKTRDSVASTIRRVEMPAKRQKAQHGFNGLSVDSPKEENTEENQGNADDNEEDNAERFAYTAAAPETTKFYGNAETYSPS
jgi:hypothetical protein